MKIVLNGEPKQIERAKDIPGLLEELGLASPSVLVEHNGLALRRDEWPQARSRMATAWRLSGSWPAVVAGFLPRLESNRVGQLYPLVFELRDFAQAQVANIEASQHVAGAAREYDLVPPTTAGSSAAEFST